MVTQQFGRGGGDNLRRTRLGGGGHSLTGGTKKISDKFDFEQINLSTEHPPKPPFLDYLGISAASHLHKCGGRFDIRQVGSPDPRPPGPRGDTPHLNPAHLLMSNPGVGAPSSVQDNCAE